MSNGHSDDDLISKILNETLSLNSTTGTSFSEHHPGASYKINSNELEFLILKHELNYFNLEYVKASKVFRVVLKDQVFDFPVNWYFFKKIFEHSKENDDSFNYIDIDDSKDTERFLKVLSYFLKNNISNLLVIYCKSNIWICYTNKPYDQFLSEISKIENIKAA